MIKFFLRAVLHAPSSVRWFRYLAARPELAAALPAQPQWLHKLQRPYLCVGHDTASRLGLLREHYALFFALFSRTLRQRLFNEEAVTLARLAGKSGAGYRIDLALTRTMDKEGELMLLFVCDDTQERLVTLAFSLGRDWAGSGQILLGCLQGPRAQGGRERFRAVTKDLHGMMPKILMVKAACALARRLGLRRVLAVSNRGHVHRSRWGRYSDVRADYDATWSGLGGVPAGERFFELDCRAQACDPSRVPSSKRAQYLRRKALEDDIEGQFAAFWRPLPLPPRGLARAAVACRVTGALPALS
jgi:hypothetical protein